MTLSFRHVLLATTAFVAVSASASALTTVSTVTSTALTTSASGGILINGTGSVIVPSGTALAISATTTTDNSVTILNGGKIQSNDAAAISATAAPAGGNAALTINNAGSIITNGNSPSIALGTMTNAVTLNNSGTISGAIVLGSGANVVNVSNGTITGNISTGSGGDTYSQSGGRVNGNIDLGGGTNTVNMTGGTVSGTIGMGTGTGNFNYLGGTIGNVSGTGLGTFAVSGSRVWNLTGNVIGFNTFNISNTTVNANNAQGVLASISNVNIGTGGSLNMTSSTASINMVNDGNVRVSGTLSVANGAVFTNDLGSNGTLNANGGTVSIGAGSQVKTDKLTGLTNLGIGINTSQTAGLLAVTNGQADLTNTALTLSMGNSAGYIANGTSYSIITGSAGVSGTGNLVNRTWGVYTFVLSSTMGGNGVSVTVNRQATGNLVQSESGKAIADTLDKVGASANTGDLRTIQNTISAQSTAAGVNNVVESLAPATDTGVGLAAIDVSNQSNDTINERLASLRGTGVATGDRTSAGHMWLQGFGNITNQDDHKGNPGYNANTAGATAGVDTDTLIDGMTTGVALTYGSSNVNSKSSNDAHTDIDSYMATLYGSQVFEDNYFVNGQFGVAYDDFESNRNVIGFGSSTNGKWHGQQYSARVEGGRDFKQGPLTLTPLASAQYTLLDQKSYTENGPAALTVNPDNLSAIDFNVGGEASYNFAMDNGGTIRPRARAKYNYRAGDTQVQTTSNFVAGGTGFTTNGVEADRSSFDLGAGVLLTSADGVDFSVDYDANIEGSATGHTGQVKIRWPF